MTQAQRSCLENEQFEPHRSETRSLSPLIWFENQWTDMWTVRSLDSTHEECTHTWLLQKQAGGSRLKLPRTLAGFLQPSQRAPQPRTRALSNPSCSSVQLHTRVKAATAEERMQLRGTKPVWTQHSIWVGQGQPLLVLMKAADQDWSRTLTGVLGPLQCTPWPTLGVHSSPSCSSTAHLWGEGAGAGSWKRTHLVGTETAQTGSSGLLLQQLGTQSHPQ